MNALQHRLDLVGLLLVGWIGHRTDGVLDFELVVVRQVLHHIDDVEAVGRVGHLAVGVLELVLLLA